MSHVISKEPAGLRVDRPPVGRDEPTPEPGVHWPAGERMPPYPPPPGEPAPDLSHRSTAELVSLAADQLSRLVRDELRLARAELAEKGRHAGRGAGLLGAAGLVTLYGVAGLLVALVLGLAYALPAWLAALVVAVALLLLAGVLAMVGRRQVRQATPPVPMQAVDGVRADIEAVTGAVRERGNDKGQEKERR